MPTRNVDKHTVHPEGDYRIPPASVRRKWVVAKARLDTHPVSRANGACFTAQASAEVEGGHRKTPMLQTHHLRAAGRPVLHVAKVNIFFKLNMPATDNKLEARKKTGFH